MAEDYSLFYNILEGEMNPTIPENTYDRNFEQYFKEDSPRELKDESFDKIINISNIQTESRIAIYYIGTIKRECNRLVNVFDHVLASSEKREDFSFYITKQYDRLLLLMNKVNLKKRDFGEEFEARYVRMINLDNKYKKKCAIRDILYYFNEYLIELSLHVQKTYAAYISSKRLENINDIYSQHFREPAPIVRSKYDSIKMYFVETRRFLNEKNYDYKKTCHLLNTNIKVFNNFSNLKNSVSGDADFDHTFTQNVIALENYIFVNTHALNSQLNDYNIFVLDSFNSSMLKFFKDDNKRKLSEIHNHIDRIDFVDSLLRKNENYLVHQKMPDDIKINSLPRLAEKWLHLLKDIYLKSNESQKQYEDFSLSTGINEISEKMKASFEPSVENFLRKANPSDKYKSDWSCRGFYNFLKNLQIELEPEFQIFYAKVNPSDRDLIIKSYLSHIKDKSSQYIAGTPDNAEYYLKKHKLTLEDVFENQIKVQGISHDTFPGYFNYTFPQLKQKGVDYKVIDLHSDFIFLISGHYINKLENFISNLPVPDNSQVQKLDPASVSKPKKIIPVAYTYIKYKSNLSAITDLMTSLIKIKLLPEGTDKKEFRKIFNNTAPLKPIIWSGNFSELAYFIKLLHNDFNLISNLNANIWKITANLFVDINGNPFDKNKFRGQKHPAKADLIEKAVDHLK